MKVILQDVCSPKTSNLAQKDLIGRDGDYPVYGASGYIGNINFYHQANKCVVVVKDGAGIGRTMLLPEKSTAIGTMQYLIPKENILPEYLFYAVKNMHLEKYYTGATIPHIYFKDYKNEKFNYADLEQQLCIVNTLKLVEDIISKKTKQLEQLDNLVKALFVEMFGDPVANDKHWPSTFLAEKCTVITGNTPSRANSNYYGNFIEWIKSDNITRDVYLTKANENLSIEGKKVGRYVGPNNILMTCIAGSIKSIGNVAITDREVAFNQQINAIKTEQQNTQFMYMQFLLSKDYICSDVNMSLKGIISKSTLSRKKFIFPPLELQKRFADVFIQIDKHKSVVQKSLDETQLLFDSLMQKYFG